MYRYKMLMVAGFNPESTNVSQADGFERNDCEVIRFDYRERGAQVGNTKRDLEIIYLCQDIQPDFVFFSKCNDVSINVVEECNRFSTTILWYMDPVGPNMGYELIQKAYRCDYIFVAAWEPYLQLKRYNKNTFFVHEGFDHLVSEPISIQKEFDVSFIGSFRYNREEYCKAFDAKVFTSVYGLEHTRVICQSRINLNFTAYAGGTSDRSYKILASKGFLLTEPWPMMEKDFKIGKDLVVMHNIEEGKKIIQYYLQNEHEREVIACSGFETVQKFSRINFAKSILEIVKASK